MSDVLVDDAGGDSFHFDNHARELCVSRCKSYYCGGYGFFIGQGCTGFQLGGHQRRLRRQCQRAVNSAIIGTTGGNNAGLPLGSQLYGLQTAGTCTNTSIIGNQVSGSPASLVLAACTSDGTTGQAAPKLAPTAHATAPAQAVPVNPPPILKMTGATPDPGPRSASTTSTAAGTSAAPSRTARPPPSPPTPARTPTPPTLPATARATTITAWS